RRRPLGEPIRGGGGGKELRGRHGCLAVRVLPGEEATKRQAERFGSLTVRVRWALPTVRSYDLVDRAHPTRTGNPSRILNPTNLEWNTSYAVEARLMGGPDFSRGRSPISIKRYAPTEVGATASPSRPVTASPGPTAQLVWKFHYEDLTHVQ